MTTWRSFASLLLVALTGSASTADCEFVEDWPQFRGWRASGIANGQAPPVEWDIDTRRNVRWKRPIPGLGHASPIILRGCVFIVTARSSNQEPRLRVGLYGDVASVEQEPSHTWQLYCLSKYTGQLIWERTLRDGVPHVKRHPKSTHAKVKSPPSSRRNDSSL